MKTSELFEGDNSSLRKTYDEAVAQEIHCTPDSSYYLSNPPMYRCKHCGIWINGHELHVCKIQNTQEIQEWDIEELIEEIADCFSGQNLSYHAGQIRTLISQKLKEKESNITERLATMYKQGKAEGTYEAEERHKRETKHKDEEIAVLKRYYDVVSNILSKYETK
jgi:hypothetical protein